MTINVRGLMSDAKFFEAYSRFDDEEGRYETWEESIDRVMTMHRTKYSDYLSDNNDLSYIFDEATSAYKDKLILGAQRALQFGGDQLLKNNMRNYNCTSSYCDRAEFFGECLWVLLCGAGVGMSVQHHHIARLPEIAQRNKQAKQHIVEDSIEGWATALDVLMSSFFVGGGKYPEFEGRKVYFDLSQIRSKGAKISGGFKAPGPEPLRLALDRIECILQGLVLRGVSRLRSIDAYDIVMHSADCVLAGGIRRAATIVIFSPDDILMMKAKTGNWFDENPQRGRSNNSALILRDSITKDEFDVIMENVKEFGEPGFVFASSLEFLTNPCVEIGMLPQIDGKSGWQGCNLSEINGSKCVDKESFFKACRAASIIGTLQAGYTDFPFLSDISKDIFERESLIGVSITGWMNSPNVLFDEDTLREGARIVKETNKEVAAMININPAARTTCVKPSGNASVILGTSSGIHGEHSPTYFRIVQMNKDSEVGQLIKRMNPYMVEDSVWSANNNDYAIYFPVVSPKESIYKEELNGTVLLKKVQLVQQTWVEEGTNIDLCIDSNTRHNVSNTITVEPHQWGEVADYLFENRASFAGVSFLSSSGDKDYAQAPNTMVKSAEQIIQEYGDAALFASGLIVDSAQGFSSLWEACRVAIFNGTDIQEDIDATANWIRRFKKFASTHFDGDLVKASYCLKDVHLLHKWDKVQRNYQHVEFVDMLQEKSYTDINSIGAAACSGGACEVEF